VMESKRGPWVLPPLLLSDARISTVYTPRAVVPMGANVTNEPTAVIQLSETAEMSTVSATSTSEAVIVHVAVWACWIVWEVQSCESIVGAVLKGRVVINVNLKSSFVRITVGFIVEVYVAFIVI